MPKLFLYISINYTSLWSGIPGRWSSPAEICFCHIYIEKKKNDAWTHPNNILSLILYWWYPDKKCTPPGNDQSIDVPCGAVLASRSANAREAAAGEPATGTLPSCYTCTAATRLKLRRLVLRAVYLLLLSYIKL